MEKQSFVDDQESPRLATPLTRRLFMTVSAIGLLGAAGAPALARTTPEDYAVELGRKVITLARSNASDRQLKRKFLDLLTRNANIRAVARFALGKYRRRIPKSLMPEYYRLVLDYIAGMFVYYRRDLAAEDIRALKSRKRGSWTTVETVLVFPGGKESKALWRIYTGGGPLRVGDLNIKGIWLSLRMRDKFVSILNKSKGDFSALMQYLRENAA